MPVDPTRFEHAAAQRTVTADLACNSCGYNLRGLETGTPCPECGTTIPVRRYAARGDNLTDAPAGYLRPYALWAVITACTACPAVLLTLGGWVTGLAAFSVLGGLAAMLFIGAAALLTKPRPRGENTTPDATIDDPKWRLGSLAGPAAWIVLAFAGGLSGIAAANVWQAAGAIEVIAWLGFLLALVAMVPMHIHLGSVAAWAGDTGLASRFRGTAWIFGIGVITVIAARILALIVPSGFAAVIRIVSIGFYAVIVGAILLGLLGFVQFAGVTMAAVRTNAAQHARDRRIAERRAAEMSDTVERQRAAPMTVETVLPASPPPIAIDPEAPRPRIGQGQRIEPGIDQNAYELEPEDGA